MKLQSSPMNIKRLILNLMQ